MKKIYRKNFEIQNTALHMGTPAGYDLIIYQPKTVGKVIIKELVWVQKDYYNIASYVVIDELRELIKKTIEVIYKKPKFIQSIHQKTENLVKEYFKCSKTVLKKDLTKLTNKQLFTIYKNLIDYQKKSHGYAITTTWFVDSDGEDFSKLLIKRIEKIIKNKKTKLDSAEVFSILTTPDKLSLASKEEMESLKILKEIKSDKLAYKIFQQKDITKIENNLSKLKSELKNKILRHYKKWRWVLYTYIGPAYELDYYLTMWSGLLKENINIDFQLKSIKEKNKLTRKKKKQIINELKIDNKDKILFDIAAEIIYLKAYRKDAWFFACYVLERIHKEIAKRLGLSLKQVRFIADWEIKTALEKNYFSTKILNERIKFCVYYQKKEKGIIYIGKKAKQFLNKIKIEKEKNIKINNLSGTCACPGKKIGTVKIINSPKEMDKMNQGDIMVAHTTFPALVPAMKKAAAIITDDGGITCHAAIVARELKKPCIVGTKIATKALKNGDKISIDANKGIIKKLK